MSRIEIGAPSLTGKGANTLVAEAFGKSEFPLSLTFKNLLPRNVSFPEAGLFLRAVLHPVDCQKTVTVASLDVLQRLASSIEQIATLNHAPRALVIDDGKSEEKTEEKAEEKAAEEAVSTEEAAAETTAEAQAEEAAPAAKKGKKNK